MAKMADSGDDSGGGKESAFDGRDVGGAWIVMLVSR